MSNLNCVVIFRFIFALLSGYKRNYHFHYGINIGTSCLHYINTYHRGRAKRVLKNNRVMFLKNTY